MPVRIVPDYNQEKAKSEWHIISQLNTPPINLLRRVNELIDLVPIGMERDTYQEFVRCATNLNTSIVDDGAMELYVADFLGFGSDVTGRKTQSIGHRVRLELHGEKYVGENYIELCLTCDANTFVFQGSLYNNGMREKYHDELQYFLLYHLMDYLHKWDDKRSKIITMNLYVLLIESFKKKKRYSAAISLTIPATQRAIVVDCRSVEVVAKMCNNLEEYLEVKGRFKSAALVYAEAGEHLYKVGHHLAVTLLINSGLSWRRNAINNNGTVNVDDVYEAERYYTMALHSVCFQCDSKRYQSQVFSLFKNIHCLYKLFCDIFPKQCFIFLQELLHEADSDSPILDKRITRTGVLSELRPDLHNIGRDRIICVIQSIIETAHCPKDLRKAIIDCGDPETHKYLEMNFLSDKHCYHDNEKTAARNHMKEQEQITVQQQCCACRVFIEENKLLECKW